MTKNEKRALVIMCIKALENVASEAVMKQDLGLSTEDLDRFYEFLCEQEKTLYGTHPDFKQADL